jgi:hypothetical protein
MYSKNIGIACKPASLERDFGTPPVFMPLSSPSAPKINRVPLHAAEYKQK